MPFSNPIVGGTTLIRPAIHSPDYVAGSAGWSINKDGSAEFNDVTIRGDGNGDALIVGPDNGPQVQVGSTASSGYIQFPTNRPIEHDIATIIAAVTNSGAANESATLQVQGPSVDGATDRASILLNSQNNDNSSDASINMTTGASAVIINELVAQLSGQRLQVIPDPSTSSAIFLNADVAHTGNLLRLTVDSVDRFVVDADGNTDINGDLTAANIQKGLAAINTVAGQWAEVTVNFPTAFTNVPVVTVTGNSAAPAVGGTTTLYYAVTTVTTTSFVLRVFRGTAINMNIGWIAIG